MKIKPIAISLLLTLLIVIGADAAEPFRLASIFADHMVMQRDQPIHVWGPRDYQHKMRALINGWRAAFGNKNLPVYFVQLPGSSAREGWPYLREQQRLAADLPHTGMVVTIDIDGAGIHPANKIDVGYRLARWALAKDYGKEIAFSGPMFERQEIQGDKIVVHFKHAESGLMVATKDGLAAPSETLQFNGCF